METVELPYPARADVPDTGGIVLHNTIGPSFSPIPGAYNIALPLHEWSRYPRPWSDTLNRFDEIWVASRHVGDILSRSGVDIPVHILPPALDKDPIPEKTTWNRNRPFRFLSVGEAHFRKGFHLLMEAFTLAFRAPGEAELVIKTSPSCAWQSPREDIIIDPSWMDRSELLGLYRGFDAYVTASLGEGLNLTVAEAILARLPVAANYWGGHVSLLDPGPPEVAFFPVEFKETEQVYCSTPEYFAPDQMCAYSSPDQIATTLRKVVKSSSETRRILAGRARVFLENSYTTTAAVGRIKKRVDTILNGG